MCYCVNERIWGIWLYRFWMLYTHPEATLLIDMRLFFWQMHFTRSISCTECIEVTFCPRHDTKLHVIWPRDFVLYILPLGLVRLRTFRLSTWLSLVQTWTQVLTRARGGCVIHRCQNKNPLGMGVASCAAEDLGRFEKVS